jgi:hypothetical protein
VLGSLQTGVRQPTPRPDDGVGVRTKLAEAAEPTITLEVPTVDPLERKRSCKLERRPENEPKLAPRWMTESPSLRVHGGKGQRRTGLTDS